MNNSTKYKYYFFNPVCDVLGEIAGPLCFGSFLTAPLLYLAHEISKKDVLVNGKGGVKINCQFERIVRFPVYTCLAGIIGCGLVFTAVSIPYVALSVEDGVKDLYKHQKKQR